MFYFYECWSCSSIDSAMSYSVPNHILCSCVVWLCLWYGLQVCN